MWDRSISMLVLFLICCVAFCLRNWYILFYGILPAVYLWKRLLNKTPSDSEDWLCMMITKWEALGCPYYLHDQPDLVEYLSSLPPNGKRDELVTECNLFFREMTGNNKKRIKSYYHKCLSKDASMKHFMQIEHI